MLKKKNIVNHVSWQDLYIDIMWDPVYTKIMIVKKSFE